MEDTFNDRQIRGYSGYGHSGGQLDRTQQPQSSPRHRVQSSSSCGQVAVDLDGLQGADDNDLSPCGGTSFFFFRQDPDYRSSRPPLRGPGLRRPWEKPFFEVVEGYALYVTYLSLFFYIHQSCQTGYASSYPPTPLCLAFESGVYSCPGLPFRLHAALYETD